MRHLVKGRKLGRTAPHRRATLSALAVALIHERQIKTTLAKAKELRGFVEPLITRSKVDTTHNRREVFSKLRDKYAVTELFEEVGPKSKDRPGGYTRVLKLGYRQGDSAEMAMIELVDYNDVQPESRLAGKKRTRRAGRSKPAATPADKTGQSKEVPEDSGKSAPKASESKSSEAKPADSDTAEASLEAKGSKDSSVDFKVTEVKEKLESMDVEEAKAFVAGDDRVTVQKALDKKIDEAPEDREEK